MEDFDIDSFSGFDIKLLTAGLNGSDLLISVDVCEVRAKIATHCCKMKGEVIHDIHCQTVCVQKLWLNVSQQPGSL